MVFAGSGEFNLAHLSEVSKALDYIFMAAVHQHISQDTVEVYGYSGVRILFKNVE